MPNEGRASTRDTHGSQPDPDSRVAMPPLPQPGDDTQISPEPASVGRSIPTVEDEPEATLRPSFRFAAQGQGPPRAPRFNEELPVSDNPTTAGSEEDLTDAQGYLVPYVVDRIGDHDLDRGKYSVRWTNYSPSDDTWEPRSSIFSQCGGAVPPS